MSRNCPVPGCQTLLFGHHLMCCAHWDKVPTPVVTALNETERTRLQARDDTTKRRAEIEHQAAWHMALTLATYKRELATA